MSSRYLEDLTLRSLINDFLRWLIGLNHIGLGLLLECLHRIKMRTYFWRQQCLRQRYQIAVDTPVLSYGPELERHIQKAARGAAHDARFGTARILSSSLNAPDRKPSAYRKYIMLSSKSRVRLTIGVASVKFAV